MTLKNYIDSLVKQIEKDLGLTFVTEKEEGNLCFINNNDDLRDEFKQTFAPIDLLDYIYAVLHSPSYREKYKEFLKIDFLRVPYPQNAVKFWQLVKLGSQLRVVLGVDDILHYQKLILALWENGLLMGEIENIFDNEE